MTHSLRFRSGQVQLRSFRVLEADAVTPGDLMVRDGQYARPASTVPVLNSVGSARLSASSTFLGVAHSASAAGEAGAVSVDVSAMSVYEVAVRSGSFEIGDLLGPDDDGGAALSANRMDAVGDASEAVARAAEFTDGPVERLRVTFASSVNTASANAAAQLG